MPSLNGFRLTQDNRTGASNQTIRFFGIYIGYLWGVLTTLQVLAGENQPSNNLEEILQLNQQISQAVCDEAAISHSPSLVSTPDKRSPQKPKHFFWRSAISDTELIEFLLENPARLVTNTAVQKNWEDFRSHGKAESVGLRFFKRKLSLDLCVALVTPGKIDEWIKKDAPFWEVTPVTRFKGFPPKGFAEWVIQDVDQRFGDIQGKKYIAGWLESYEVLEARFSKRIYRRLAHPITNQLDSIQVFSSSGVLLGFFFTRSPSEPVNWERIKARSGSEEIRKKLIDTYRLLVEISAQEALKKFPQKLEAIKKLQDFYKNLLNAYVLYPEDGRFQKTKKAKGMLSEVEIKGILDADFLSALNQAKPVDMQSLGVDFGLYPQDGKLQELYQEYTARLAEIAP